MSAVDVSQPNRMGVSTPGSTGGPSNPSFQQQRFDQNSRSNTPRDPYGRPIPPPNQSQQQAAIKPPQGQDGWPASSAAPPRRDWSQVDARSAAAAAAQHAAAGSSLHRDHSPNPAYLVHSSPRTLHNQFGNSNDAGYQGGGAPPLAAPRAVQPYPRQLTSPQPLDNARSPSPSKRAQQGFNFADNERWSSLGQSQQLGGGQAGGMGPAASFQPRKQPGLSFNTNGVDVGGQGLGIGQREGGQGQNGIGGGQPQPQQGGAQRGPEPFLGYNDLIFGGSNRGQGPDGRGAAPPTDSQKAFAAAQQQQQLQQAAQARSFTLPPSHGEMDQYNSRFDGPPSAGFPREDGPYSAGPGGMREQLQYASGRGIGGIGPGGGIPGLPNSGSVSPRSLLHYHNQQIQAQQALAQQAAQIPLQAGLMGPPPGGIGPPEEITTVFIVGFPDDMTEREFANMFLFAKGFEASTLKIPAGGPSGSEPPQRNGMNGPGGPYNQVNMHGGLFDMNGPPMGAWDDPLSLAISRGNVDPLSLANLNSMNQGPNSMGLGPGGKIKQIIGFAKFRSRPEALEARDALNGRKIDAERGCVLKTEMAKKNLHTKQRPVLVGSNPALPNDFGPPSSNPMVAPSQPPFGMAQPPNDRDRFPSSAGPASAGGFGGSRPPNFEPFPGSGGAQSHPNGMLSPGAEGYSNPSTDFFGRGEASSFGGATSQASKLSQDGRASGDKWSSSMGPLDYYAPDSSSQQQHRQLPASNSYSSGAGGWPSREDFAKHESTSRNSDSPPNGDGSEGQASGHSQQKYEEALARHQQQQMLNIQQQQQQQFASRFGSMRLGADSPSNERPQDSNDSQSQSSPSNPVASFEQHQRQQQQSSSSSSHPHSHAASPSSTNATDLLQVTGFPSRPGSPEASHFEGELRHKFSEQPGFKNLSFQASQNGSSSNCLVEFSDVQSAARAMNALNGDTLNGILGQGGIRIGFARRENQFNDISGRDLVSFSTSTISMVEQHFDLDTLNYLEETSYREGFESGHAHGQLHGTFEGRQLGREKGFEIWEEVGFYQGMAAFWRTSIEVANQDAGSSSRKQTKQLQHLRALESLISVFPTANSSGAESTKRSDLVFGLREEGELEEEEEELDEEQARGMDMSALLERIRARYKLACSILGVAPRETSSGTSNSDDLDADDLNNHKARIGGKLVDPNQLRY